MTKNKLKFCAVLLVGFSTSYAQQASVSAGGNASGSGGSVAYSIGQVAYSKSTGSGGSSNQGVQQTYEIITFVNEETALGASLAVFPNPTAESLILEIADFNNEKLTYQLLDIQGNLKESNPVNGSQTLIKTGDLPSATYFLNIIQNNSQIKSFKIIKKSN